MIDSAPGGVLVDPPITLTTILDETLADQAGPMNAMAWTDAEIDTAAAAAPSHADIFFHSFGLLRPGPQLAAVMTSELVIRSHARELLARLSTGADTRPATAVELFVALHHTGRRVPLHGAAAGLYFRLLLSAFPGQSATAGLADRQGHYESLYRDRIDDLEEDLRRRFTDAHRTLAATITCTGRHHGDLVACRYAASTRPLPERPQTAGPPRM
ncbi:hypothetical protein AB0B66_10605 [Catellatospora sp. NPDC049111]|uniref:hypothetical protein n=1 Tax=Catellatospora sp. NPDC049111 TaxID=3155271 RepID=UPI00340CD375